MKNKLAFIYRKKDNHKKIACLNHFQQVSRLRVEAPHSACLPLWLWIDSLAGSESNMPCISVVAFVCRWKKNMQLPFNWLQVEKEKTKKTRRVWFTSTKRVDSESVQSQITWTTLGVTWNRTEVISSRRFLDQCFDQHEWMTPKRTTHLSLIWTEWTQSELGHENAKCCVVAKCLWLNQTVKGFH